jgi:hypothetical protein
MGGVAPPQDNAALFQASSPRETTAEATATVDAETKPKGRLAGNCAPPRTARFMANGSQHRKAASCVSYSCHD